MSLDRPRDADPSPTQTMADLLGTIAGSTGLAVDVSVEEADGEIVGRFEGDDVGPLIGRHGQTIDAIQHLARRIVFSGGEPSGRVVVDADGYRDRRATVLREEADDAAEEALEIGAPVELDAMPASDRRVVHEHLRLRGDVTTHSEGEEPERFLVISPLQS